MAPETAREPTRIHPTAESHRKP